MGLAAAATATVMTTRARKRRPRPPPRQGSGRAPLSTTLARRGERGVGFPGAGGGGARVDRRAFTDRDGHAGTARIPFAIPRS